MTDTVPAPLPEELGYVPVLPGVDNGMSKETINWALENFKTKPTDVICATFPKTGTTLVTWICHQLRTGGHVDFEDIYQVAPWILLSWDIGMDPNVDGSQFFPRVFKSHLRLGSIFRGCKYIVTIRDPLKTTLSFYNFLCAKGISAVSERSVSEFLLECSSIKGDGEARGSIWDLYKEYYICKDCPSVLVVVYEDMVKDMHSTVRLIADFMNIDASDELVEKVVSMSSKEFMAQHESKMDETWVFERAQRLGRSPDNASSWAPAKRVVIGQHTQELNEDAKTFLEENWKTTIASATGLSNYTEFAALFREKNNKKLANISAKRSSTPGIHLKQNYSTNI